MCPVVGITTYAEQARFGAWDLHSAVLPFAYVAAVAQAGAIPVLLPPIESLAESVSELIDRLDGLILSGGPDIDPAAYGEERDPRTTTVRPDRDRRESQLLSACLERDLPVLGICRGMELINVVRGGTVEQHLPDRIGHSGHCSTPGQFDRHAVTVQPGSRLASIVGDSLPSVCSYHHQGVARLGDALEVVAWAADGTAEAIEVMDRRFAFGVLWHPECDADLRLFQALVTAAGVARQ